MNEGRAELQRVILQYEKQRAEAIRSKQEAEIVLPFVRAALEELDAALGQSDADAENKRAQTKRAVAAAKESRSEPATFRAESSRNPVPSGASVFGVNEDEETEAEVAEERSGFNRASIASLIDENAKSKQKTG